MFLFINLIIFTYKITNLKGILTFITLHLTKLIILRITATTHITPFNWIIKHTIHILIHLINTLTTHITLTCLSSTELPIDSIICTSGQRLLRILDRNHAEATAHIPLGCIISVKPEVGGSVVGVEQDRGGVDVRRVVPVHLTSQVVCAVEDVLHAFKDWT